MEIFQEPPRTESGQDKGGRIYVPSSWRNESV